MIYPWLQDNWSFLIRSLRQQRLAHALMIEGTAGTGKQRLSDALVALLLCTGVTDTDQDADAACGQCRSCELLSGGAHPDYFDIHPDEGKDVIRVDQVRQLIGSLHLTTSISQRKLACIHPAELMNIASANALLKSLEEPAGDAVLILVCNDPGRLPVTVRSRCQSIVVSQPDRISSIKWLEAQSGRSADVVQLALEAAGGSPVRALEYIESPDLDAFGKIRIALAKLLNHPGSASIVSQELIDLKPDDLWRWLSSCCAEAVRLTMTGSRTDWLPDSVSLNPRGLLDLQRQADINRKLSASSVRGDLLLQDWLIRWAEQVI